MVWTQISFSFALRWSSLKKTGKILLFRSKRELELAMLLVQVHLVGLAMLCPSSTQLLLSELFQKMRSLARGLNTSYEADKVKSVFIKKRDNGNLINLWRRFTLGSILSVILIYDMWVISFISLNLFGGCIQALSESLVALRNLCCVLLYIIRYYLELSSPQILSGN